MMRALEKDAQVKGLQTFPKEPRSLATSPSLPGLYKKDMYLGSKGVWEQGFSWVS